MNELQHGDEREIYGLTDPSSPARPRTPESSTLGPLQERFGNDVNEARAAYRKFVDDGMDDPRDLSEEFITKLCLGGAEWMAKIQELVDESERSEEAPRAQVHPARPAMEDVLEAVAPWCDTTVEAIPKQRGTLARRMIAYIAFEDGLIPLRKIARALGVT